MPCRRVQRPEWPKQVSAVICTSGTPLEPNWLPICAAHHRRLCNSVPATLPAQRLPPRAAASSTGSMLTVCKTPAALRTQHTQIRVGVCLAIENAKKLVRSSSVSTPYVPDDRTLSNPFRGERGSLPQKECFLAPLPKLIPLRRAVLLGQLARPGTPPAVRTCLRYGKSRPVWLTGGGLCSGRVVSSAYLSLRVLLSRLAHAAATLVSGFAPPGKVAHPAFIR